ncbi:hypothetical protein EZV62_008346 [Acer yangbiense]|uniref:Uncharacterized protein n=1 Tax=Acer yangbiense TaxID=1000413 RepID=A0A5C7ID40_9ROSI|nr:hypothetical protein EZV62_008346 [Acer yangbiense]
MPKQLRQLPSLEVFILDGLFPCIFEFDAEVVVRWINEKSHLDSVYGVILSDIISSSSEMIDVCFGYVAGLGNQVTHLPKMPLCLRMIGIGWKSTRVALPKRFRLHCHNRLVQGAHSTVQVLFPPFQKYVIKVYVSEDEAGKRVAQVVGEPSLTKSGVYWSWNKDSASFKNQLLEEASDVQGT